MKAFDRNSMTIKISFVVMFVIILEAILLIGSVLSSGGVAALKDNPYISFSKNTETHKSFIKDEMILDIGNIFNFAYNITDIYDDMLPPSGELTKKDTDLFLEITAPIVIDMLNSSFTTGSFLLLNNDEGTQEYNSLYFVDYQPTIVTKLNEDIKLFRGPVGIADSFSPALELHPKWEETLILNSDNQDVIDVPVQRYAQYKNIEELGYWQVSSSVSNKENLVLTYTIPLADKNGNIFGILGMVINEESFHEMLPRSQFAKNELLGHMLAKVDTKSGVITPLLNFTNDKNKIAPPLGVPLELSSIDKDLNLYQLHNANADFPVLASIYCLGIYDNTPFADKGWVFIGLADKDKLDAVSTNFITALYTIFIIIILAGAVLVYVVARRLTKPIVTLADKVETNDLKTILSLSKTKTGYSEVDTLAKAIERFHRKELEASAKTDKIIRMVNLPLGTFEYSKDTDRVTCSETLLRIMDIPAEEIIDSSISQTLFFQKINAIKENVEDDQNNVYMIDKNTKKWVKLVTAEHDNTVLGICLDVTAEVLNSHLIKYERDYDGLTNLFNRLSFKREIEELFQGEIKDHAALVIFDLDNLKYINDTYGHSTGDFYIRSAAQVLSDLVQEPCIIGRISGDEFYIFLHGFESQDAIRKNMSAIYEHFDRNHVKLPDGSMFKLRMSGGIAWYGQDSKLLDELLLFADFAMYQGKNTVKGELVAFDKKAYENESFMLSGKEELNNVLDNHLIDYAFQVIVSAKTGEIYGYESLMRPRSSILDTPIKLLKIASAQSQLWKVERITLTKTLAFYKEHSELFNDCKIFINSVPNESLSDAEYANIESTYSDILKNIVIEITENEKLENTTLETKRSLIKKWDAALALDDYGSGYNGDISMLNIKPHIVKIDRLMIADIETDKGRQAMIQKLIEYAREENIIVLAEGVETFSQMNYLVKMGVDLLQGYYIAKPGNLPNYNPEAIAKEIEDIHDSLKK